MCGVTLAYFGAPYPDAICIEGYLWDADSDDGEGGLTSGGEIPCPDCNTGAYLRNRLEDLKDTIPQPRDATPAQAWEYVVKYCLSFSPVETARVVSGLGAFELFDTPGRIASTERLDPDPDLSDLVLRAWPWPVPGLSAHQMTGLHPRTDSGKDQT